MKKRLLKEKIHKLKDSEGFMRYFRNTSWLFAERILRFVVSLFVSVWVARYLGPDQFGLLSYLQSFVALFAVVATLGLDGIVIRELVKDFTKRDRLLGTAFLLKMMGSCMILLLLSIVLYFQEKDFETRLYVLIIGSATFLQSLNVIDLYFQSRVMSKYVVYANTLALLFSSAIKVILILNHCELFYFVVMVLIDSLIVAVGFVVLYFGKSYTITDWRFDRSLAINLLRDSWPLILSGAVLMVQARIDQVMLKAMIGNVSVGQYSVALKMVELFCFIPVVLSSSLFPLIQEAKNKSIIDFQDKLLFFYRLCFTFFLIVYVPMYLYSEDIVLLLFGDSYQGASMLISVMALRLFFTNMGVARSVYIIIENLTKYAFLTMVIGTVVNVLLNYFWITKYQEKGAVLATLISFFVTTYLIDILYSKTRINVWLQIKSILTFYRLVKW